ncbi:MAG: ferrous iron transporter B [Rhodospirillaceae bacterium]
MTEPAPRQPRIALVGIPNCGKSALFNALTGSRQKVANYPGVTVERKEGGFITPAGRSARLLDLPGTYSLRARSPDEAVTRDVLLGRQAGEAVPDIVVCVADATNLRLHLRLVLEVRALGLPVVLALNMMDVAERRGYGIDCAELSRVLAVPVVRTVAIRRDSVHHLLAEIDRAADAQDRAGAGVAAAPPVWREPGAAELRELYREVGRLILAAGVRAGRPAEVTRRIDAVLLHPTLGLASLLLVLFLMFQAVFTWAKLPMELINGGVTGLQGWVLGVMAEGPLRSLIADGVIAGVGSVVIFLPQILILFLFILLLEDSGYLARAAFLLDRLMGGVGLHGRAFIPLLSSFACAVPGIMAARTIDNREDRLATILIAPLMTCSARLPVYALLIAAFIPDTAVLGGRVGLQGLVMFCLFAAGIVSALGVAFVLKRTLFKGQREPLLLELPTYKLPSPRNIALGLYERAKVFLVRAGTVIFSLMVVIWFLATFPGAPEGADGPAIAYSIAGIAGRFLEPLLAPLGFTWQIAVALIPGMAAREVAVATLGTIYAVSGGEGATLAEALARSWSVPTALALLAWYVFAPQCAATIAVVKRETNSWGWAAVQVAYMLALAYLSAFATFRIASWALG